MTIFFESKRGINRSTIETQSETFERSIKGKPVINELPRTCRTKLSIELNAVGDPPRHKYFKYTPHRTPIECGEAISVTIII